ncbi:MAG: hypothetical protein ACPKOI_11785 [Pleomorphochaeta sp.]
MHPKQIELESRLHKICMELDNYLEDEFGTMFPLHPKREKRGKTSSANYDGLFSTGVQFTTGYGSQFGRGYLLDIDIRTLSWVTKADKTKIEEAAIQKLKTLLEIHMPERKLEIKRDQNLIKIVGDFSLGISEIN